MIWGKQWELFAPNFKNGKAHIDLTPYRCPEILQLYPGPGFGDLSHPTTRIVLTLMQPYIENQTILDIGCGSGILSLAAAAMGASKVYGYDIDPEAVEHAKKNATLSRFQKKIHFSANAPQKIPAVLLINMISSEQAQAWSAIEDRIPPSAILITSGILKENAVEYLDWRLRQGWEKQKQLIEKDWIGFVFAQKASLI
ncbi:MAG TPA: 50S ribosomal protein L11 methyltransferase [Rhabdochlamydiaceae bacterium]|jgi:ribosomal protein L11 methyltransferase|nr:50S ribosomal protein L11 methyltransferase [Rhabdochlamydiaceae bacterium]